MEKLNSILPKNEEEYLKTRVLDQIRWYDQKSLANKRIYLSLKISEIILALCIPLLSAYIDGTNLKLVIGLLGVAVAAIAGIITLIKYQENWIEYRTIAESLKYENFLFLSKAGPYKGISDPFPWFVERFESLISTSTKKWISYTVKRDPQVTDPNKIN
jgi:hypothetical protein